jgi:hypothetical protein
METASECDVCHAIYNDKACPVCQLRRSLEPTLVLKRLVTALTEAKAKGEEVTRLGMELTETENVASDLRAEIRKLEREKAARNGAGSSGNPRLREIERRRW